MVVSSAYGAELRLATLGAVGWRVFLRMLESNRYAVPLDAGMDRKSAEWARL